MTSAIWRDTVTVLSHEFHERSRTYTLTLSNGRSCNTGHALYSWAPFYEYIIEAAPQLGNKDWVVSATPQRRPLTGSLLGLLLEHLHIDYDLLDMVDDPERRVDMTSTEDQLPALRSAFPQLITDIEDTWEGFKYIHVDRVIALDVAYSQDELRQLSLKELKHLVEVAWGHPTLLCFTDATNELPLRELDTPRWGVLCRTVQYQPDLEEAVGVELYQKWLKPDVYQWGHTYSNVTAGKQKHPVAFDDGLDYLLRHDILIAAATNPKHVYMKAVLEWEETIRLCCKKLQERFKTTPTLPTVATATASSPSIQLSAEQAQGLDVLRANAVAILSGGAGTGKTTILSQLVAPCPRGTFLACAPTNKAARELNRRGIRAQTVHRLLGQLPSGVYDDDNVSFTKAHAVIIDEASMLPLRLFSVLLAHLVEFCPHLCRVYLVGDVAQLPSIEAGSVLNDMSRVYPLVTLKENRRVEHHAVLLHHNAVRIREQQTSLQFDDAVFSVHARDPSTVNTMRNLLTQLRGNEWNTHILCPFREGAKELNAIAKELYTGHHFQPGMFDVGDKIICNKNHHKQEIINGDLFRLVSIDIVQESRGQEPQKVVKSLQRTNSWPSPGQWLRFGLQPAPLPWLTSSGSDEASSSIQYVRVGQGGIPLKDFSLGYCTTNHKFQGCENENIVFFIPEYRRFITWQQLYTAVTRARRRVILVTDTSILHRIITTPVYPRRSKLAEHLVSGTPVVVELDRDRVMAQARQLNADMDDEDEIAASSSKTSRTPYKREHAPTNATDDPPAKRTRTI